MATTRQVLDANVLRSEFPSLARMQDRRPVVFADAPGGTQVPLRVIDAMASYLRDRNANTGGAFAASRETDELIAEAHRAAADFVGAAPDEVAFGPNMTTLAFALSRSLAQLLSPGDEIVVTRLDHDANIAPWLAIAADTGAIVKWADVFDGDCTLDLGSLDAALGPKTRIVAFTLASNALGSVTPAAEIVRRARTAGASAGVIVIGDAVHFAPHRSIDARALGVDVLFCSPYKFFGPHLGIMYGRRELLGEWPAYKVRPQDDRTPDRWETGTLSHEALAGFVAGIEYLAGLGDRHGATGAPDAIGHRRTNLVTGMDAACAYEATLSARFLDGIADLPGVRLFGVADATRVDERTPTFALRIGDHSPRSVVEEFARRGVFAWDGNYYALAIMERLGLEETGGAVRIGFCHYNTPSEVDRVLEEISRLT